MFARIRTPLLTAALLIPSALLAQGVVVHSVADVRLFGALGTMANIAAKMGGGNLHDIQSTTSVAGHKMRTDSQDGGSIIDVDAGRIVSIDHKQKSYTSMTFEEIAAAMEQAAQSAKQNAQQAKVQQQSKSSDAPKGDVKLKYSASVDRPRQHETVAGYDAERIFITITVDAEVTPEGEKTEQAGSLVLLVDQWRSKDAPQIAAIEEFQRAYAKRVGQTFRPPMKALEGAFQSDPRIKVAFEASAKELAKVPGVALRSVTYAAIVPPGMTFDRALVLGDAAADAQKKDQEKKEAKPKSRFGGLVGAIKSAAEQANKQPSNDKSEAQQPKQVTLLSVSDEVKSIDRGAVPADTFLPPAGYRQMDVRR